MNTKQLQAAIEAFAPSELQEEWDNTGWNVDLHNEDISGVMICLDVTPEVVQAAQEENCQVIVSHHPLLFRAIKRIDSDRAPGRCLAALIAAGISLYCAHTSADSTLGGINMWLGERLGLENTRPLVPQDLDLCKIAVTVPAADAGKVKQALMQSGAGTLGEYADCTFAVAGEGTFRPLAGSHPAVGQRGVLATVAEIRLEALVPGSRTAHVSDAVRRAHPYEMPAIDIYPLRNADAGRSGLGVIGDLPNPLRLREFAELVRRRLDTGTLQVSGSLDRIISRVGLVGGSGGDLVSAAENAGCDVFLTGELRHNTYYDHDIALITAGHYDTEKCFVEIMQHALQVCAPVIQCNVDVRAFRGSGRPYIDY